MNLTEAHDTARRGAERFGNTWRVYRMPLWPAAVYSCKAGDLPTEALVLATYPNAEVRTPKPDPAPASADVAQGSLF